MRTAEERKTMKSLPEQDRPYEKMEMRGARSLSDSELLSILLVSGTSGSTALETGQEMLGDGRSLADLAEMSPEELQTFRGIGRVKSVRLLAAFELAYRLSDKRRNEIKPQIRSSGDAIRMMEGELASLAREEFHLLCLDVRGRLIRKIKVAGGGLSSILLHPRDVFREAVRANAASVILCHNHPSGDANPSPEDLKATECLKEAGRLLGIQVADHIVVGRRGSLSLREEGYL